VLELPGRVKGAAVWLGLYLLSRHSEYNIRVGEALICGTKEVASLEN